MGWKEERDFRKWRKAENIATRSRRQAQQKDMVCAVCGKGYYDHKDYGEVAEHRKMVMKGKQWVKK